MITCEDIVLKANSISLITVKHKPGKNSAAGLLSFGDQTFDCRLGRSGITSEKKEGDGATPVGQFSILYGFYRADRITLPETSLQMFKIKENDGWCDDDSSEEYNKLVELPFAHSHEKMCREDRLYNICLVLDYNINPVEKGKGSAIFFHLTSEALKPTEGCVAINPLDMLKLLPNLSQSTMLRVEL